MPNHIHGIIEIKKSMDVLDRDARDNVGAKNFSPQPHPPSPQPHPPSPVQTSLPYPKKCPTCTTLWYNGLLLLL